MNKAENYSQYTDASPVGYEVGPALYQSSAGLWAKTETHWTNTCRMTKPAFSFTIWRKKVKARIKIARPYKALGKVSHFAITHRATSAAAVIGAVLLSDPAVDSIIIKLPEQTGLMVILSGALGPIYDHYVKFIASKRHPQTWGQTQQGAKTQ